MRDALRRLLYHHLHQIEMSPMPPAFGVRLQDHLNDPTIGPGFVCEDCGRAFADPPRYVAAVATATGVTHICRCVTCACQSRYRDERMPPCS
jgi:hypothetical protein